MEHPRQIPETDWKLWRELQKLALERFCQKALDDFAKFKDAEGTAHERYLKLYLLVKQRDKKLGQMFDGPSRSNAVMQLSAAVKARVITRAELDRFTEETRKRVAILTGKDG